MSGCRRLYCPKGTLTLGLREGWLPLFIDVPLDCYLIDRKTQELKIYLKNSENYFFLSVLQKVIGLRKFCRDIRNRSWRVRKVNCKISGIRYLAPIFGSNPSMIFYPVTGKAARWFSSFSGMGNSILLSVRCLVCVQIGVFKGKYLRKILAFYSLPGPDCSVAGSCLPWWTYSVVSLDKFIFIALLYCNYNALSDSFVSYISCSQW